MHKAIKWMLISGGVALGAGAAYYVYTLVAIAMAFGAFDPTYTKADLIQNYEGRAAQIQALSRYINDITPAGKTVVIEFDGDQTIPIFHVGADGLSGSNWDVKWNSSKTDTLLQQLGWPRQTLTTLHEKLQQADCISIASGEPSVIGYKRSGMGKFSYDIFARPLSDSLSEQYNNACTYIFYKPRVVLEYGGGAVGPQCFPDYRSPNGY